MSDLNLKFNTNNITLRSSDGSTLTLKTQGSMSGNASSIAGLPIDTTNQSAGQILQVNSSNDGFMYSGAGSGDMARAVYDVDSDGVVDEAASVEGVGVAGNSKYYGTNAVGTAGFHSVPVLSVNGATGAVVLNTNDVSEASNLYYTEARVSANSDVAANTAARHSAVTVTDSPEINFTLAGQDITASLIAGSIDKTKLNVSANASLSLADSSVQPGDNVSGLTNDAGYITATLTQKQVEDFVGGMFSGNTEILITATYQSVDGTIDLVVNNDLSQYDNTTSGFITGYTVTQADVTSHEAALTIANTQITGLGTASTYDVGTASGNVPVLGAGGKISDTLLPSIALSEVYSVADDVARDALSPQEGDVAIVDLSAANSGEPSSYIYDGTSWKLLKTPTGSVSSVFGRTGTVTAQNNDYTWAQIDKTTSNIADITTKSHTSLTDIGSNTHAQIDAHIADVSKHRQINDTGTATTDLWSASKITTELAGKANSSHTHAASDITSGTFADARISVSSVTQYDAAIDHNALLNYVAAEHIDWTVDQGATNINAANITGLSIGTQVTGASTDLTDVTITTPANNEVLAYDSITTSWINQTPAEAGIAAASHTHTLSDITDSGSMAAENSSSVTITGGSISGITDLAVADGGTGASTASGARTNLGLVIGTNVQAWDLDLDTWATKTAPTGTVVGTSDTQTLTNKTVYSAFVTLGSEYDNGNSGTSGAINWNNGNIQKFTLTGNATFSFTDPTSGDGRFSIRLVQDATGGRTVIWPANVKWPGGIAPTISTAASAEDIITFEKRGSSYYGVASQNFS